jgi:hypothetical protein
MMDNMIKFRPIGTAESVAFLISSDEKTASNAMRRDKKVDLKDSMKSALF